MERRMIALINERDILITKWNFYVKKIQNIEKISQKYTFLKILVYARLKGFRSRYLANDF